MVGVLEQDVDTYGVYLAERGAAVYLYVVPAHAGAQLSGFEKGSGFDHVTMLLPGMTPVSRLVQVSGHCAAQQPNTPVSEKGGDTSDCAEDAIVQ